MQGVTMFKQLILNILYLGIISFSLGFACTALIHFLDCCAKKGDARRKKDRLKHYKWMIE